MTNGAATPSRTNRWQNFERTLRRAALVGGLATTLLITITVGPQFIYALAGLGAAAAYIVFPDEIEAWFQQNEALMVGAAIGFVYGNIPGMVVGGWLGHYINRRVRQGVQAAQNVADAVEPYVHPIDYTRRGLRNFWQRCQNYYDWLMEEEIEVPSTTENDLIENLADAQTDSIAENIRQAALTVHPDPIILSESVPETSPEVPVESNEHVPGVEEPPRHSRLWNILFGERGAFPNGRVPTLI